MVYSLVIATLRHHVALLHGVNQIKTNRTVCGKLSTALRVLHIDTQSTMSKTFLTK